MVGEVARGLSLFGGASSEVRRCICSVVDESRSSLAARCVSFYQTVCLSVCSLGFEPCVAYEPGGPASSAWLGSGFVAQAVVVVVVARHLPGLQDRQTDRQFGRKTHSKQLGCCATHLRRYKCNVSPPKRHLRRG